MRRDTGLSERIPRDSPGRQGEYARAVGPPDEIVEPSVGGFVEAKTIGGDDRSGRADAHSLQRHQRAGHLFRPSGEGGEHSIRGFQPWRHGGLRPHDVGEPIIDRERRPADLEVSAPHV